MITFNTPTFIFLGIMIIFLILILKPREQVEGRAFPDIKVHIATGYLAAFIVFTMIWGGFFWW